MTMAYVLAALILGGFGWWFVRQRTAAARASWDDGVVVTDPVYAAIYAKTADWVRTVHPEAVIAPEFRLTVRLYDHWPKGNEATQQGRILAPNVIAGDTGGTLCLARKWRRNTALIVHECKHAVTGVSDHPRWLFPEGA